MTPEQIERLKTLCDAHKAGALRGDEFTELVKLAQLAATSVEFFRSYLELK